LTYYWRARAEKCQAFFEIFFLKFFLIFAKKQNLQKSRKFLCSTWNTVVENDSQRVISFQAFRADSSPQPTSIETKTMQAPK
jgi:hypothetical protein